MNEWLVLNMTTQTKIIKVRRAVVVLTRDVHENWLLVLKLRTSEKSSCFLCNYEEKMHDCGHFTVSSICYTQRWALASSRGPVVEILGKLILFIVLKIRAKNSLKMILIPASLIWTMKIIFGLFKALSLKLI